MTVGADSFINRNVSIYCGWNNDDNNHAVTIGKNVFIGPNVTICVLSHEMGDASKRAGKNEYRPVIIGDGSWVGLGATILSGVKVAEGCVIAAGAVVVNSTEPNGLYAGVPAIRIKELN